MTKKTIVAFVYDFDHTLSTTDRQNYSFIPSLDIKTGEFWSLANERTKKEKRDPLLAYRYLRLLESKKRNLPITREAFQNFGKDIQFFPGVEDWFPRINKYGQDRGVEVQHYVISSGNREIIEGSKLFKYFKEVFACEYYYENGEAVWPKSVVNYTTKTQYLYRINKGVLDIGENNKVNASRPDEDKPVPFENRIYIADGETDVPCRKTVRSNGGYAIAVYDKKKKKPAARLFNERRVDFLCEADYSEGSLRDKIAKLIIDKVAPMDSLVKRHYKQRDEEGRK